MTAPKRSFGFASRYLLLLIVAAVLALVVVIVLSLRAAPPDKRGELGPLGTAAPGPTPPPTPER